MGLDFDSTIAAGYVVLAAHVIVGYILLWQPLTAIAIPWRAIRSRAQGWYIRFTAKLLSLGFDRTFIVSFSGDQVNANESAITVVNHQSWLDYMVLEAQAERWGLAADLYYFVYSQTVRFPTIRTLLRWKRGHANWRVSPSSKLINVFKDVNTTSQSRYWVVIWPEVSIWSKVLMRQHRNLCEASGCPPLNHLLYPRFAGFSQSVEFLRGTTSPPEAVYVFTVLYHRKGIYGLPQWQDLFLTKGEWTVEINTVRYPLSALPARRKDLERWLEKQWFKMDDRITSIYRKAT